VTLRGRTDAEPYTFSFGSTSLPEPRARAPPERDLHTRLHSQSTEDARVGGTSITFSGGGGGTSAFAPAARAEHFFGALPGVSTHPLSDTAWQEGEQRMHAGGMRHAVEPRMHAASGGAEVASGQPIAAAVIAATGLSQNDSATDRFRRLSGAIAGSIFQDLLSGAIRVGELGPPPASEAAIAKLARGVTPPGGTQCPICLCEFETNAQGNAQGLATQMPCGHYFHEECLLQWLRSHNTCPVCRFSVEQDNAPRTQPLFAMLQSWRENRDASAEGGPPMPVRMGVDHMHTVPEEMVAPASELLASSTNFVRSENLAPASLTSTSTHDAEAHAHAPTTASASSGTTASTGGARVPALLQDAQQADNDTQLQRLSVLELKRRLASLGVDFSQAIEKHELLTLLRRHLAARAAPQQLPVHAPRLHVQVQMEMVQHPAQGNPASEGDGGQHDGLSLGRQTLALPSFLRLVPPPPTAPRACRPRTASSASVAAPRRSRRLNTERDESQPLSSEESPTQHRHKRQRGGS